MEAALRELRHECDAEVTIEIGEPLTDCRADDSAVTWPADAGVYIKATVNARQSDYKPLFMYVNRVKKSNPIHRATAVRMAQASCNIAETLRSENRKTPGPASLEYWATVQARQHDDAPVVQPNNETFRQLNYIDARARQHQHEVAAATSAANAETRRIHIMINGVLVPIDLNIQEVRAVLGLPGYDLRPPFRERAVRTVAVPEDAVDLDHADVEDDRADDFDEDIEEDGVDDDGRQAVV
ncbi:uncharacterized protein PITG_03023 [Phytophthora infestans T30-4]|uniref:Uncharacterized protein n=1 Tax=Phytophthora infestans (strain T30-4) TaxID=403677 RepID=D0MZ64_PHYIT|nr:uncharacterized protein PITG_03023 [Phytophthora infestans T30-4]EEY65527.1 conserved hypothetical protein [Phytophthora infestans T30-4]|eukprot:XP_002906126.1 conserved hypothetical protein [Phytophthora infestans T30-4]